MERVKLTGNQITCLSSACRSQGRPIYGENPAHMFSQMPGGASCYPLRTIESLEKRGYLRSDGKGGYLPTDEGHRALRMC